MVDAFEDPCKTLSGWADLALDSSLSSAIAFAEICSGPPGLGGLAFLKRGSVFACVCNQSQRSGRDFG